MSRRTKVRNLIAVVAVPALLVAAANAPSVGATTEPSGTGDAPAATGDIPEATQLLNDMLVRPTELPTTEPIGAPVPTGKVIDWIVCGVPECTALTAPLEDAAAALGWSVNSIDGGLSPETVQAAWNLAVENGHDAVVATGFPRVMFADALAQLEANGVPVVNGYVTDEPGDGVIASTSGGEQAYADQGKYEADFVLGRVGTDANVLFLGGSTFPGMTGVQNGVEAEMTRLCPDCPFDALDLPGDSIGTTLPATVVAYLETHPDVNYLLLGQKSMILGLPQALDDAGLDPKIVSNFPDDTTVQMVKDGDIDGIIMLQQADSMWQMVDALARYFAGVSVEPSLVPSPVWAITADNVDQLSGDPYVLIEDYEALYKALWGVD